MDTNVLVAAFRSRRGASFEVFHRLRLGQWTVVLSNHLLFEYEEILKRDAAVLGLSMESVDEILNAVCARGQDWPLSHGWHPVLTDPDDEPLVQLAVESEARRIVTHNLGDLQPATRLGVEVFSPRDFLAKLQE